MFNIFKKVNTETIVARIYEKNRIRRYISFVVGVFITAVSFNLFFLPNKIVYGGVSGLSILTEYLFKINPSEFIFASAIVLLIISFFVIGKKQTAKSAIGSILFPVFIYLTSDASRYAEMIGKFNTNDVLLMAIFGGVLTGVGSGMVWKAGFTSGGTDILNQIVVKYFKISVGKAVLFVDGLIVIFGVFVLKDWSLVMYAITVLYIISLVADKILLGISEKKAFYIITNKESEVKEYITENLGHGVTILKGSGGYSGEKENVLMCVVPTKDYFKFKEGINEIDEEAFFVVTDAYEVCGGA